MEDNKQLKLNKQEVCKLLNTNKEGLKTIIRRKQLESKFDNIGYKLIDTIKKGRTNIYIIEQYNEHKELYSNICKYVYNTDNDDSFTKYFLIRTDNEYDNKIYSKKDVGNIAQVCTNTIGKWDTILLDKNIISNDGYFYFYIDMVNNETKQCSVEEYKSFWRNKSYIKAFHSLEQKYIAGKITTNELMIASADIGASIMFVEGKYYYRTKKYKTNNDNQLYIDTLDLIKLVYVNQTK